MIIKNIYPEEDKIEYIKDEKVIHSIIGKGVEIIFLDVIPSTLETTTNSDVVLLVQSNIPEKIKIETGDGSNRYLDLVDMEAEVTLSYSTPGTKFINVLAGLEIRSLQIEVD